MQRGEKIKVLPSGEAPVEAAFLAGDEGDRDLTFACCLARSKPQMLALPALGRMQRAEHLGEGGLAGAVRPQQAEDLTALGRSGRCP